MSDENLSTCRACLMLSDNTYPIFENITELNTNIATMLNNCSLEVQDYEVFPNTICSTCFETVQTVYNFIETFKKSQELLLFEYLKQHKEQVIVVQDDENTTNNADEHQTDDLDLELPTNPETFDDSVDMDDLFEKKFSDEESEDQDFLIAQSVKLTEHYKLHKSDDENCEESSSESDAKDESLKIERRPKRNDFSKIACPLCPKKFRRFAIFSNHLHHHKTKTIPCKTCSENFENAPSYLHHYQLRHRYHCKTCNESFPQRDAYHEHLRSHKSSHTRFTCPVESCAKTFAVRQSLRNHYRTIHCEMHNFLCSLCGLAFKNYDNLRYHMKKHKGPSHLCTYCGRKFMQAVHLTYHMWRHTGEKPYKCVNCDKRFVSKNVLLTHMKRNCGSKKRKQLLS